MSNYVQPSTAYLLDKLKISHPQVFQQLANGVLEARQVELVHTVKLSTLTGNDELLLADNKFKEAVSSFDGNQLPAGAFTSFDEVSVQYGFSANDVAPETVEYSNLIQDPFAVDVTNSTANASSYTLPKRRIPVPFQNASIVITNGNLRVYEASISSHLVNDNKLDTASKQFVKLVTPKMFIPQTPIGINFRGVKAGAVPNGFHYIKVVIRAIQTVAKTV